MPYKNPADRKNYNRKWMQKKRGGVVEPVVEPSRTSIKACRQSSYARSTDGHRTFEYWKSIFYFS